MKRTPAIAVAILLFFFMSGRIASAHRLDEYLQATLLTLQHDHVDVSMRLIPGVSVAPTVIASIDTNRDGILSAVEQQSYARRVLDDLTLTADGHALVPSLVAATFPEAGQMREGLGEIHIDFTAPLPVNTQPHSLVLENHHQNPRSVYLVNAVAPTDPSLQILAQKRNELQSVYELNYQTTLAQPTSSPTPFNTSAFAALFDLGLRHIAEGTDHLLFLLALLLPAPLIAVRARWLPAPTIRPGLLRVLRIVTAFTLGHSLTLALAALGFVRLPSRPVEVLIALSILISALHALRPLFPGKEAAVAAFFGLIHGLAFAATLTSLGLGTWDRLAGILAFNLGIEAMQLLVVAAALPSLLLLSRTPAYPFFRIPAALLAALAALGWIAERLLHLTAPVDILVNAAAHHAPAIAAALFLVSLGCWQASRVQSKKAAAPPHLARLEN
jgi:hypothetical protein